MAGHGWFMMYPEGIKKRESYICMYGDDEDNTYITTASKFDKKRIELPTELGTDITVDDLVEGMLRGKENWTKLQITSTKI